MCKTTGSFKSLHRTGNLKLRHERTHTKHEKGGMKKGIFSTGFSDKRMIMNESGGVLLML
jgi:hypothetical protein